MYYNSHALDSRRYNVGGDGGALTLGFRRRRNKNAGGGAELSVGISNVEAQGFLKFAADPELLSQVST
jgi:hypothetical protein